MVNYVIFVALNCIVYTVSLYISYYIIVVSVKVISLIVFHCLYIYVLLV